jgi:hypothetical protein
MNLFEIPIPSSFSESVGLKLSESEPKAYENSYLSMLFELCRREEIRYFQNQSSKNLAQG